MKISECSSGIDVQEVVTSVDIRVVEVRIEVNRPVVVLLGEPAFTQISVGIRTALIVDWVLRLQL